MAHCSRTQQLIMLELLSCLVSPVSFFLLIRPQFSSCGRSSQPRFLSRTSLNAHTALLLLSTFFLLDDPLSPTADWQKVFPVHVYVPRQEGSVNVMMATLQWGLFSSGAREGGGESGSPSLVNMCFWPLRNSDPQWSGSGTFHFSYGVGGYQRAMASIMAVYSATSGRRYRCQIVCLANGRY